MISYFFLYFERSTYMKKAIIFILAVIALMAFSWIVTCGFVKLIFICFAITFTWKIATGIWLTLLMLAITFSNPKKE